MITRRTVLTRASLAVAGAVASPAILHWPANAAEFAYKYGTALPEGHPMVIRSKEAAAKIKEESGGKLDITIYPNSVLGQDTAMISQAIAGALEMYGMPLDILAQKSPVGGGLRRRLRLPGLRPCLEGDGRRSRRVLRAVCPRKSASIAWTRRSTTASGRSP